MAGDHVAGAESGTGQDGVTEELSRQPTPFGLKYQLERDLRPFNVAEVRGLPKERTGVYALWLPAEGGVGRPECLYVGMSEACVRRRLRQHIQHETNPGLLHQLRLFRDIVLFSVAFTHGREETLALETAVIRDWQPITNRLKLR